MNEHVRLALAAGLHQGILASGSGLPPAAAARLALAHADALLEAAKESPAPARNLEGPPPATSVAPTSGEITTPKEGARRAREIAASVAGGKS